MQGLREWLAGQWRNGFYASRKIVTHESSIRVILPFAVNPHRPLPVGGNVGCLRDAPSSPSDAIGSFVLPSALGEEGVWDALTANPRITRMVVRTVTKRLLRQQGKRDPRIIYSRHPPIRGQPSPPPTSEGKVGCLRDAPSSPSPTNNPHPLSLRLGEGPGVWDALTANPRITRMVVRTVTKRLLRQQGKRDPRIIYSRHPPIRGQLHRPTPPAGRGGGQGVTRFCTSLCAAMPALL